MKNHMRQAGEPGFVQDRRSRALTSPPLPPIPLQSFDFRKAMPLSRAEFLRAALTLAALPVLRSMPAHASPALSVSEVASGVFVHTGQHALQSPQNKGDIANVGIVIGKQAVAVIDTSGSARKGVELLATIRSLTDKPIRYVVNTHMHPDHVFGNAAFKGEETAFVGHHKLARGLSARAEHYLAANKEMMGEDVLKGTEIILPNVAVEEKHVLDLGDRKLICEALPTAHTDNDLIVYDTGSETLFLGDLLFSEHVPTIDGSIVGWLALMDSLPRREAKRVVPGHGPASMSWPSALQPIQSYLAVLAGDIRRLIKEGASLSEATKTAGLSERDAWRLFDQYHARNISAAFAELEWE